MSAWVLGVSELRTIAASNGGLIRGREFQSIVLQGLVSHSLSGDNVMSLSVNEALMNDNCFQTEIELSTLNCTINNNLGPELGTFV
ncbi:hypothetical protein PanWU01x14_194010 [Parasponia andersonii]|uniref:Uncharacterized protein n=1 Tax=Parasponia andersonii TaxID=3476 RepID=A0A2P5C0T5_PARAD|nr:hypothetical protein PanWU01x14_194010 [Parasponia andersonii]